VRPGRPLRSPIKVHKIVEAGSSGHWVFRRDVKLRHQAQQRRAEMLIVVEGRNQRLGDAEARTLQNNQRAAHHVESSCGTCQHFSCEVVGRPSAEASHRMELARKQLVVRISAALGLARFPLLTDLRYGEGQWYLSGNNCSHRLESRENEGNLALIHHPRHASYFGR